VSRLHIILRRDRRPRLTLDHLQAATLWLALGLTGATAAIQLARLAAKVIAPAIGAW
jgi:hypothetical protein